MEVVRSLCALSRDLGSVLPGGGDRWMYRGVCRGGEEISAHRRGEEVLGSALGLSTDV